MALFLDIVAQVLLAVSLFVLFAFNLTLSFGRSRHASAHLAKMNDALILGLGVFALFLLFFGYFILFEGLWGGRTPGKFVMGIRVVRDGGYPVDFLAAVIRNVVRVLEFGLGFYLLSAISALLSPQNKRLGDLAAGTLVVRDLRYERDLAAPMNEDRALREGRDPAVRGLSLQEREIVRRYVARREEIEVHARGKLAADIAARIRPRLGANFSHLDDDALLVHLTRTAL
jgi:uncharacterized RDD family membrane protein YckC